VDGTPLGLDRTVLQVTDLSVSPDGNWFAFTGPTRDQQLVIGVSATDGSQAEVIMQLEGSGTGFNPGQRSSVRWPPPGDAIVVGRQVGHGINLLSISFDVRRGSVTGDTRMIRSGLPLGASFDISLDRNRLVYAGGPSRAQLVSLETTGEDTAVTTKRITQGTWQHTQPSISWDGESVAYLKGSGTEWDLYALSLSDGTERRLTRGARPVGSLAWAPDGSRIAFAAELQDGFGLMVVDANSGETKRVGARGIVPDTRLEWTADGRELLYRPLPEALREPQSGRLREIGRAPLMAIDLAMGAESEFVVDGLPGFSNLLFSTDGHSVVAFGGTGRGGNDLGLWIASLEDGAPRRLVAGMAVPVAWSGDQVYFVRDMTGGAGGAQIERIALSGGTPEPYVELPEECRSRELAVSRDATKLVCAVAEVESDVWVVENVL
jgi:Tol biopolymer transport system component